jgi:4-hydroxybenzoate polyprenyltransferase
MSTHGSAANTDRHRSPIRTAATIVAIVFLAVGILGFIPGVTTDYDQLELAGHESHAMLLGIFEVSVLHNIVHLLFGIAGLALARTYDGARNYLIGGGVVYLLLWLYGLLIDVEPGRNTDFVPFNEADNWLHLVLGLGMIGLGVALSRDRDRTRA